MAPWGATSVPKTLTVIHAEPMGTPCALGSLPRFSLEQHMGSLSFLHCLDKSGCVHGWFQVATPCATLWSYKLSNALGLPNQKVLWTKGCHSHWHIMFYIGGLINYVRVQHPDEFHQLELR